MCRKASVARPGGGPHRFRPLHRHVDSRSAKVRPVSVPAMARLRRCTVIRLTQRSSTRARLIQCQEVEVGVRAISITCVDAVTAVSALPAYHSMTYRWPRQSKLWTLPMIRPIALAMITADSRLW